MKILEINNLYNGAGAENVMKMIGGNLTSQGHEVFYVTTQKIDLQNHISLTSIQQNIFSSLSRKNSKGQGTVSNPLDGLGKKIGLKLKRFLPLRNILINRNFEKIIKNIQPNLVHIHNLQPFGVGILEICKKYNIPTYLTLHGYWPVCPSSLLYTDKERQICNQISWQNCNIHCGTGNIQKVMSEQKDIIESSVTQIITVSDYVKNRLLDFGYNAGKITTIHNGVDTKKFCPVESPTRDYMLHVGRLSEIKGSKLVLEVAREFPETRFLFIGSKKPEMDIPENAEFVEWIDSDKLVSYYQNAKAVLAPSLWPEPHSLVPLEVMACGTAIVATNVGGNNESITESSGILIDSPHLLRDVLIDLSVTQATLIGHEGRKRAEEFFSVEKMHSGYKRVFGI